MNNCCAEPVSVVVPARNEALTIGNVVKTLSAMRMIDEVVVVDNGSTDDTGGVARAAGGRVVSETRPGMGHAIRAGFMAARNDWVMKVDADLDRFNIALFSRMIEARRPGVGLIKGQWQDPRDPMPMTRYLVMPALHLMFPGLSHLKAPNSGIYAFDRSLIALPEIVGDYAADLDVMLRVHAAGAGVAEVDIGRIDNNPRDPSHYSTMTETILAFFLRQRDLRITDEFVVVAGSARQVILSCLGLIAGHARAGGRVSVFWHDAEPEADEALRAALDRFPTVSLASGKDMPNLAAGSKSSRLRIITEFPLPGADHRFREMQAWRDRFGADMEFLLMARDAQGRTVDAFLADHGFSVSDGAEIKNAALARLGISATGPREVFQSFFEI